MILAGVQEGGERIASERPKQAYGTFINTDGIEGAAGVHGGGEERIRVAQIGLRDLCKN